MHQLYTEQGVPLCLGCHKEVKKGQLYILVAQRDVGMAGMDGQVTLHVACLIAANEIPNPALTSEAEYARW